MFRSWPDVTNTAAETNALIERKKDTVYMICARGAGLTAAKTLERRARQCSIHPLRRQEQREGVVCAQAWGVGGMMAA